MSIICGPIVRHANRGEINVWIAVDTEPATLSLKIYESAQSTASLAPPSTSARVKLGNSCFCYLLTAKPDIKEGIHRVYYDIELNGEGFRETGLDEKLCFPGFALPSLLLPATHTRFMQASCRKPHDEEGIDQLAVAARSLFKATSAEEWPSQLFLTGDQIYADDVSPLLLDYLHKMAEKLEITAETVDDRDPRANLDGRKRFLKESPAFTSAEADSHLLTFAEYFCMYLFSFGVDLPELSFSDYKTLDPKLSKRPREKHDPLRADKNLFSRLEYAEHRKRLDSFSSEAKWVRKLLANIATYTIFDDHEVTDDWNLGVSLSATPTGNQVLVNALAAYLVCQHWGNQPESVVATDLENVERLALDPAPENRRSLEHLQKRDWGYILRQAPPAVVLDTRTGREHAGNKLALISRDRLKKLGQELSGLPPSAALVVVSPTPVFGFTSMEAIQLEFPALRYFFDREPWIANKEAARNLQDSLCKLPGVRHIVIFSGDVHYAFMRRQETGLNDKGEAVTCWQLCSSPSCNTPTGGEPLLQALNEAADRIKEHLKKERTRYLRPEDSDKFLTGHKNVCTLTLDGNLAPRQAVLHCSALKPRREYQKVYGLASPREIPEE